MNRANFRPGYLVIVKFADISKEAIAKVFLSVEDIDFVYDETKAIFAENPGALYAEIYKRMDSTNHWAATRYNMKADGSLVERNDGICMIGTNAKVNELVKAKYL
jgi:hypothetical protein